VSGPRILIVDDDPAILRAVRRALEARDYEVELLDSAGAIPDVVARFRPDVILLDLVLPDGDGIEITRSLRPATSAAIVVLSAVGDESKKVLALDAGAEDYVTKPFGMEELLARVRVAVRRRATNPAEPVLSAGPVRLDMRSREVAAGGTALHLTPTEFDLLRLLLEEQGRVLTQRLILERVWGPQYVDDSHILRTFIHQLRQKLSAAAAGAGELIVTDPGVGYRLVAPPDDRPQSGT
jgi:two-component system KDP operon response regulator KdpE